jgi:hypothetical protein
MEACCRWSAYYLVKIPSQCKNYVYFERVFWPSKSLLPVRKIVMQLTLLIHTSHGRNPASQTRDQHYELSPRMTLHVYFPAPTSLREVPQLG